MSPSVGIRGHTECDLFLVEASSVEPYRLLCMSIAPSSPAQCCTLNFGPRPTRDAAGAQDAAWDPREVAALDRGTSRTMSARPSQAPLWRHRSQTCLVLCITLRNA